MKLAQQEEKPPKPSHHVDTSERDTLTMNSVLMSTLEQPMRQRIAGLLKPAN